MKETPPASRLIVRLGLLILGSWLLSVGFKIFPASTTRLIWLPVALGVSLAALASFLGAAILGRRHDRAARAWILIATLAGVVIWFAVEIIVYYPRYRADTMVLSHIAAEETLRGRNPYTLETAAATQAVERLGCPLALLTQTTDGKPIARVVAYPALHFLVFVPALAVGVHDLRWVVMMLDSGARARAVTTPFLAPLVVDGHGLSALSKAGLAPDSPILYGALTAGAGVIAAAAYWAFFPRLREAIWILPAAVIWVSYRSFHNYVIYWIAPAFLWFMLGEQKLPVRAPVSAAAREGQPAVMTRGLGFIGVLMAVLFVSLTAAVATVKSSSGPIGLKVIAVSARVDPNFIDAITVEVTNRTAAPIEPIFTVIRAAQSVTWRVEEGPRVLGAEARAIYGIVAPAGSAGLPARTLNAGEARQGREPVLLRVTARGTDAVASIWIPGW